MMINGDKWRFLDGNMINVDFLDIAMFEDTGGYHPDLWPLRGGLNHQHSLIVESLLPFTAKQKMPKGAEPGKNNPSILEHPNHLVVSNNFLGFETQKGMA